MIFPIQNYNFLHFILSEYIDLQQATITLIFTVSSDQRNVQLYHQTLSINPI